MKHIVYWLVLIICYEIPPSFGDSIYTDNGGPDNWPNLYPTCGGMRQSPINLPRLCKSNFTSRFPNIRRNAVTYERPKFVTVSLTDHGVQIVPSFENSKKITITGGPIRETFILEQAHFHWGTNNSHGSEHSIDNKFYAIETHAVYYNSKYGSFQNSTSHPDGLVVTGYLLKVVKNSRNHAIDSLTKAFGTMQRTEARTLDITNFPPMTELLPPFQSKYFTYMGSLTTPLCNEAVQWLVSAKIMEVSEDFIQALRGFYTMEPGIVNNFRPVQPLNSRKVVSSLRFLDHLKCFLN